MAVYNVSGDPLSVLYDVNGNVLSSAYDIDGNVITGTPSPYILGTAYPVDEMTLTDSHGVTSASALHTRHGSSSVAYTPTVKGNAITPTSDYEWVEFSCNINTNGENAGIWVYTPPESCPAFAGKSSIHDGLSYLRIRLNNSSYSWQDIHAGWDYYYIGSPPNVITSISVAAINLSNATNPSSMYIDSLEVGFHARNAHIMFNLDCVPSNFIDVGYPLFQQYGLKCTLHYPISNTNPTAGADSSYLNIPLHEQLMAQGYEWAVYSGWKSYEYTESVPFYDDETEKALFEAHAERMWKVNNDSDIYAPSCIHSTGFLWGYVYNDACRDYDFLMIRHGNCGDAQGYGLSSYFDPDVRTMMPYFIENVWTGSATKISNIKSRIAAAVSGKRAIQIGFHQIKDSSYTPSSNDIYIGEAAVEELLSYVKGLVNSGDIVCCTTAEYAQEMIPDAYEQWLTQRQHTA